MQVDLFREVSLILVCTVFKILQCARSSLDFVFQKTFKTLSNAVSSAWHLDHDSIAYVQT